MRKKPQIYIYIWEKSSVGTTDINNGFQPSAKLSGESLSLFPARSSVGTTDIINGFQPGDKRRTYKIVFIFGREFRRNDRYYQRVLTLENNRKKRIIILR